MNEKTRQLIELIGIFALVASLIFVGLQLSLDRRIAMAEQYFNRSESVKSDFRTYMESEVFFLDQEERWALGERPSYWDNNSEIAKRVADGEISVSSVWSQILSAQLEIIGFDNIYYQYKQSLIDEDFWLDFRRIIKQRMLQSEFRSTLYQAFARPTIKPEIDAIANEIESEF